VGGCDSWKYLSFLYLFIEFLLRLLQKHRHVIPDILQLDNANLNLLVPQLHLLNDIVDNNRSLVFVLLLRVLLLSLLLDGGDNSTFSRHHSVHV